MQLDQRPSSETANEVLSLFPDVKLFSFKSDNLTWLVLRQFKSFYFRADLKGLL